MPYTKRLVWKLTYPSEHGRKDYTATIPGGFARVYYTERGQSGGPWFWTASRSQHIATDYADTVEEAVRLAEEALMGPIPPASDESDDGAPKPTR